MNRQLTLSVPAREELRAAVSWYEERSPGLGQELLAAARECFRLIREQPGVGSPVPGVAESVGARRVALKRFPYTVVYVELGEELRVLAFAHMRRRPGYWRNR
ncbi:type II toxin-antitoxin system RelE/ParE family toxin [Archangium sp.]|uniref:type II toxin-antitoxin system RelE/ParE family toxin n=1 Tax=Archangium sp. TaxID=1872627 RepID=UPI002EDA01B6